MAQQCRHCGYGYNSDNADICLLCDHPLNINRNLDDFKDSNPRMVFSDTYESNYNTVPPSSNINHSGDVLNIENNSNRVTLTSPLPHEIDNPQSYDSNLEGRISHIERYDEIPPRDIYAIFSKTIIFILMFIPYITLAIFSGLLSISFAVVGFQGLSHLFNPVIWSTSIFELLEVLVLGRMRGVNTVPIYRGMIEDTQSSEYAFMFRGPLRAGNFVVGHHVRLTGYSNRGTFIVRNGIDLTSRSEILSTWVNPWRNVFWFLILFLIVLGLLLYINLPQLESYVG